MTVAQLSPEHVAAVKPLQAVLDDKCRHLSVFVDAMLEYGGWLLPPRPWHCINATAVVASHQSLFPFGPEGHPSMSQ
jgi:hypothetical protein